MKPYYEDAKSGIVIYHGDCMEVLPLLRSFDLLLTDPPYGIEAAKKGAHSSIRDNEKWQAASWDDDRTVDAVVKSIQKSKEAVVWGGNFYADSLPPSPGWLAWIKPEAETGFSLADMELAWTSGKFAARTKSLPRRDGNLHPTQKPLALMRWSLGFFPKAVTILDPFMGSGTTLRAAKDLGKRCVGIEINEAYCEAAANRLRQEVLFGVEP